MNDVNTVEKKVAPAPTICMLAYPLMSLQALCSHARCAPQAHSAPEDWNLYHANLTPAWGAQKWCQTAGDCCLPRSHCLSVTGIVLMMRSRFPISTSQEGWLMRSIRAQSQWARRASRRTHSKRHMLAFQWESQSRPRASVLAHVPRQGGELYANIQRNQESCFLLLEQNVNTCWCQVVSLYAQFKVNSIWTGLFFVHMCKEASEHFLKI